MLISIKRFRRGKSLLSFQWVIIPAVKYILAKYQKRNKPLIKYFLSDWGEITVFGGKFVYSRKFTPIGYGAKIFSWNPEV